MAFANPIWLWGFTALAVPIAIHLLSRKEGKVIAMGSLRHLKDANTQQFKSLRLNEILLLILRCLIIILVVLFLSGLQIQKSSMQKWVLIENGLKDNIQAQSLIDSLNKQGFESHSFSSEFPKAEESVIGSSMNYWQLLEQLNRKGISEAVVIASGKAEPFKGQRIPQPGNIKWVTVSTSPKDYLITAIQKGKDSLIVKIGSVQNENTHYSQSISSLVTTGIYKSGSDSIAISKEDTISILLASDPAFSFDSKIMLASLKAIQKNIPAQIVINSSTTEMKDQTQYDWLIWLSEKGIPANKAKQILRYNNQPYHELFEQIASAEWVLSRRLNEKIALEENLGLQLAEIVYPADATREIANEKDQRILLRTTSSGRSAFRI